MLLRLRDWERLLVFDFGLASSEDDPFPIAPSTAAAEVPAVPLTFSIFRGPFALDSVSLESTALVSVVFLGLEADRAFPAVASAPVGLATKI